MIWSRARAVRRNGRQFFRPFAFRVICGSDNERYECRCRNLPVKNLCGSWSYCAPVPCRERRAAIGVGERFGRRTCWSPNGRGWRARIKMVSSNAVSARGEPDDGDGWAADRRRTASPSVRWSLITMYSPAKNRPTRIVDNGDLNRAGSPT